MAAEKQVKSVLCGFRPVEEALLKGTRSFGTLYLGRRREDARARRLGKLARERGLKVKHVDTPVLDRLAAVKSHQGVVATVESKVAIGLEELLEGMVTGETAILVILDGVQDPHNLGAVIRNACLNGVKAVVLPRDRTAGITPAVEKVAAGGLEYVEIVRVGNLAGALRRLKDEGFWIVGADPGGAIDLPEADLSGRIAVVIGEEHRGLRRLTKERCDRLVRIPSTGRVASYNMGVAAGLFLFQAYIQHRRAAGG